jgi:hypothetical protein
MLVKSPRRNGITSKRTESRPAETLKVSLRCHDCGSRSPGWAMAIVSGSGSGVPTITTGSSAEPTGAYTLKSRDRDRSSVGSHAPPTRTSAGTGYDASTSPSVVSK